MTGYMFGKGIYLADVVSKAGSYCHAKPESPEGILILCEVALGNVYSVNRAKNFKASPLYYHSVRNYWDILFIFQYWIITTTTTVFCMCLCLKVKGVGKKCPSADGEKKIGLATCFTGIIKIIDKLCWTDEFSWIIYFMLFFGEILGNVIDSREEGDG